MSISTLRHTVQHGLLDFAWRQWAELGLAGHRAAPEHRPVDPEALLLFTIEVARRDPRLFDEMLDWLCVNGQLLILQRIRNLAPRFAVDADLLDAVLAWVATQAPNVRWPSASEPRRRQEDGSEPVFKADVASFTSDQDPVFARFGYLRPPASRSGKSMEPQVHRPSNLAFRLRLFFGSGTRSEVMRVLLTTAAGPMDAASIADEAGYAKRNVHEALTGLAASGAVQARWSRNERRFTVARDKWASLLEIGPDASHLPQSVPWQRVLPTLVDVLVWLEEEGASHDSAYLASSRARDLVERVRPALDAVAVTAPPDHTPPGEAYLTALARTVGSLMTVLAPDP